MELTNDKIRNWTKELATKDSEEALRQLYILFFPHLHSFVCGYIHSEETAEEIVSDVFLFVWKQRKHLLEIQDFKSYLYVIARNIAVSRFRKESARRVELDADHWDAISGLQPTPETELILSETMERLNNAVNMLPEKCRQTYRLIREHNLKYREVSDILNISVKTVEAHMALAIKRLRKALSEDLDQ